MNVVETLLAAPAGYRSPRVAQFLWQLDEQRRGLLAGLEGITPVELQWQPERGMNSIGMLLAHIAFAEAHLGQVGLLAEQVGHAQDVVGFSEEDEGLPLAADARPSPAFDGKELAWFERALAAARDHTRRVSLELDDAALERLVHRERPDGTRRVFNLGWVYYHLLEHEAGHRGQIGLLRHLYRARAR
jgi:uncharacterized damage-inducible protein DinB